MGTSIYLAGKVSKTCWRHDLVGGLRGAWSSDRAEQRQPWPILRGALPGGYDYVGPYFVSCDHGCAHRSGTHGAGQDCSGAFPGLDTRRMDVVNSCMRALKHADVVFAWIECQTCHGTLHEVGNALGLEKEVWIGCPSRAAVDELWFALGSVGHRVIEAPRARDAFLEMVRRRG